MNTKSFIWFGMIIGSALGSYIPTLWGASVFSFSSIIFGSFGAIGGIWIVFRLTR